MAEKGVDEFYKGRRAVDLSVINDDRRCVACGYALKGLRPGGKCPECGRPILNTRSYGIDEVPLEALTTLRRCITLVLLAWVAAMVLWFWLYYGFFHDAAPYIAGAAILMVVIGVLLMTTFWNRVEAPPPQIWRSITATVRLLTFLAVMALVITVIGDRFLRSKVSQGAMLGAVTITFVLWVALQSLGCLLLQRIAVLGRDDQLGHRFWNLSWATGLGVSFVAPYIALTQVMQMRSGAVPICCLGGYFVVIGFLVAQVVFGVSLLRLRSCAAWAGHYRQKYEERTNRMMERIEAARSKGEETTALIRED